MNKFQCLLILNVEISIVLQQKQTFRFDLRFPVSVTIQQRINRFKVAQAGIFDFKLDVLQTDFFCFQQKIGQFFGFQISSFEADPGVIGNQIPDLFFPQRRPVHLFVVFRRANEACEYNAIRGVTLIRISQLNTVSQDNRFRFRFEQQIKIVERLLILRQRNAEVLIVRIIAAHPGRYRDQAFRLRFRIIQFYQLHPDFTILVPERKYLAEPVVVIFAGKLRLPRSL